MGLLATCARHEPESVSAMQTSGRPAIDRILGIPEPLPYDPSRRDDRPSRSHRETRRFGPPVTGSDDVVGDRFEDRGRRREAAPARRATRAATDPRPEPRPRAGERGGRAGGSARGVAERYRESERGDRRPRGRGNRRPGGPDRRIR